MRRVYVLVLVGWLMISGVASFSAEVPQTDFMESKTPASQTIVQIYGRMCEYHRKDVEGALRSFSTVRQVEFLNDHGTVLVQYQPGSETPEQYAGAVDRAVASGWNCSVRVNRGQHPVIIHNLEGRP